MNRDLLKRQAAKPTSNGGCNYLENKCKAFLNTYFFSLHQYFPGSYVCSIYQKYMAITVSRGDREVDEL